MTDLNDYIRWQEEAQRSRPPVVSMEEYRALHASACQAADELEDILDDCAESESVRRLREIVHRLQRTLSKTATGSLR